MNKITPMKRTTNHLHSESYERGLERQQAHKSIKMNRKQALKNKRLRMALGA